MRNDRKTLVILIPGFPGDEYDSTCLPMQQQFVRTLHQIYPSLNIIIIAVHYPFERKAYQWYGVPVISLGGRNRPGLANWLLRRRIRQSMEKIHTATPIGGLLCFWYSEAALVSKEFASKNGIPGYCWLMGRDAQESNPHPKANALGAEDMIALSDFLQREFEINNGIKPAHVIPPGIVASQFDLSRPRDIDVLAAGSLIPLKQYDIFIEVIAQLKKQHPLVKASLIGNGPKKDWLHHLVQKHGLQENIELTGELPHAQVLQRMERTKIFLHPSSYEGFGMVCLEALAAGARVISFCKPMNEEIKNWYTVKDKEEIISRSSTLLSDKEMRYDPVVPYTLESTVRNIARLFDL